MELEPVTTVDNPATTPTSASTYQWLSANPLASSCGVTLSNIYCASRDYNRLTQCTIGSVESMVGYAAGTAKPVYEKVVEKLDTPRKQHSHKFVTKIQISSCSFMYR